jgi:hypothetical protein
MFGGPDAGKSTTAAGVFYALKMRRVRCELITEYAKTRIWEEADKTLTDQIYIFGKQHHKQFMVNNKVDVIITDSPLLLSLIYGQTLGPTFKQLVLETYNNYQNMNFYIQRHDGPYDPVGRSQKEEEAKAIDDVTLKMLIDNNILFTTVKADSEFTEEEFDITKIINNRTVNTVVDQVLLGLQWPN